MPLPDFIIIGERRSGTSALATRLRQHPGLFVHPKRDRGYFLDDSARKGEVDQEWAISHSREDYSAFFSDAGAGGDDRIIGEKSADYLFHPAAHARMAEWLPAARFVVILRHPVNRAWSHYWNEVGKGRETLSFEDALAAEESRLAASPYSRNHLSYRSRGCYARNLELFNKTIDPQRVFVTTLERMIADPAPTLQALMAFLGADDTFIFHEDVRRRNPNWTMTPKPWARHGIAALLAKANHHGARLAAKWLASERSGRREWLCKLKSPFFTLAAHEKMRDETRRALLDFYRPHVAALENMLGRRMAEWPDLTDAGDGRA